MYSTYLKKKNYVVHQECFKIPLLIFSSTTPQGKVSANENITKGQDWTQPPEDIFGRALNFRSLIV